jgi:hypothetical protein
MSTAWRNIQTISFVLARCLTSRIHKTELDATAKQYRFWDFVSTLPVTKACIPTTEDPQLYC